MDSFYRVEKEISTCFFMPEEVDPFKLIRFCCDNIPLVLAKNLDKPKNYPILNYC
jgi:hypothetical protein